MDMQINEAAAVSAAQPDRAVREAYRARTRRGLRLLVLAVAALTGAAVYGDIPFTGLAALLLLFGGATWVAMRRLRWEAMRFRTE
jgi:hypothetical protein